MRQEIFEKINNAIIENEISILNAENISIIKSYLTEEEFQQARLFKPGLIKKLKAAYKERDYETVMPPVLSVLNTARIALQSKGKTKEEAINFLLRKIDEAVENMLNN
jgi:hypothetical protein